MKKLLLTTALLACCSTWLLAQPCLPEGIEFDTQIQIDNFQTNYPNCTEIEGDVEISGGHNIFDLNGLNVLTSIEGNLFIRNNYDLTSLTGLENLTSIGGALQIWGGALTNLLGLDNLISVGGNLSIVYGDVNGLTGLDNLISVGENLTIEDNDNLISLTGLENLASIGCNLTIQDNDALGSLIGIENIEAGSIIDLRISGNPLLSNCETQNICEYLASPNGAVIILNNAPGCNSPPEVANNCEINCPCLPNGNYYFYTQSDIDNFQVNYPNCPELNGSVRIRGDDINNLNGLINVTAIGDLKIGHQVYPPGLVNPNLKDLTGLNNVTSIGSISIGNNDSLIRFTGLENLISIAGNFDVGGEIPFGIGPNPRLKSFAGLDNLTTISGSLRIFWNKKLTSLTGLENLTTIGGNLEIGDYWNMGSNELLVNISGLSNVNYIGGDIKIINNWSLNSLTGLEGLSAIEGELRIGFNSALTSLIGLNNLASIEGSFAMYSNDTLSGLTALENLNSVGGDLFINEEITSLSGLESLESIGCCLKISCPYLSNLIGLDNLTSIGGGLEIFECNNVTGLTGLNNLTTIGEGINIYDCYNLTGLTGLENINASSITELNIHDNYSLSTCEVQSVCDYLANPNAYVYIWNNAPGCESPEEVQEACDSIVSVEVLSNEDTFLIYPNPATKEIFITSTNGEIIKEVNIYNQVGQRLIHEKLSTNMIDVSSLKQGIYVIEVFTTESKIREKLIIR